AEALRQRDPRVPLRDDDRPRLGRHHLARGADRPRGLEGQRQLQHRPRNRVEQRGPLHPPVTSMNSSIRSMLAAAAVLVPALWGCTSKAPADPVVPLPATVKSFSATPSQIAQPGDKVTLEWAVENATSLSLTTGDGASLPLDASQKT